MAALTAVITARLPVADGILVCGYVAEVTTSGGHVTKAAMGIDRIIDVVGIVGATDSTLNVTAVKNSSDAGSTASRGDLWLDATGTEQVFFTVLGK